MSYLSVFPFITKVIPRPLSAATVFAAVLSILVMFSLLPRQAVAAELVMFESATCEWCEVWDEEIAPIYPKTEEGKRAPLRRVDIYETRPQDLEHIKGIRFTPTFVLMENGEEVGRIRGYPGEDFFWGLLGQIMEKLPSS
ncbi:transcriptional regulator [Rhodovibrionaceae bacterium A322]